MNDSVPAPIEVIEEADFTAVERDAESEAALLQGYREQWNRNYSSG